MWKLITTLRTTPRVSQHSQYTLRNEIDLTLEEATFLRNALSQEYIL